MAERRYNDEEIAAIFRAATEGTGTTRKSLVRDEGLTLAELQAIGRDVGVSPAEVAGAAAALDVQRRATQRTMLGVPIGVSRTVELNRRLTDAEWERLVVQLRETFNARGVVGSHGSLRQWTNGNLHVLLEPTDHGDRLRLGTVNGAARTSIRLGIVALGVAAASAIATAVAGTVGHAAPGVVFLGLIGVGFIASGAVRLPYWARVRERQMEALAAQAATPPDTPGA